MKLKSLNEYSLVSKSNKKLIPSHISHKLNGEYRISPTKKLILNNYTIINNEISVFEMDSRNRVSYIIVDMNDGKLLNPNNHIEINKGTTVLNLTKDFVVIARPEKSSSILYFHPENEFFSKLEV